MIPSEYNKRFSDILWEDYLKTHKEGKDFLICPKCGSVMMDLKSHLCRKHGMTEEEVNDLNIQLVCSETSSNRSLGLSKGWKTCDKITRCKRISKTKSENWTIEDTKRMYDARIKSGAYHKIGLSRQMTQAKKFKSYEDYLAYQLDLMDKSRTTFIRGTLIHSEDSFGPVMYRSTWEYKLSRILNHLNIIYKYEPFFIKYFSTESNKYRNYRPDFYIKSLNLVLEVKPSIFLNNLTVKEKAKATVNNGYNYKFITEDLLNEDIIKSIVI